MSKTENLSKNLTPTCKKSIPPAGGVKITYTKNAYNLYFDFLS